MTGADVTQQIGQELLMRVHASETVDNGYVYYIAGSNIGLPAVRLATCDDINCTKILGVGTETFITGEDGYITLNGIVRGLNLNGYTAGQEVFLGTDGTYTATAPAYPNYKVRLGYVVKATDGDGSLYVSIKYFENNFVDGIIPVANGGTGATQSAYGEFYVSTVLATTIGTLGTFVKVAGTTTAGVLSNFTHPSSNRLTYTGTATRKFLITTALSFHGTNTNDYKFAFYKNGSSILTSSTISTTATGTGSLAHVSCQCVVELETTNFIEVFVTNADAANSATVDFMNVTAVALI